MKLKKAIKLNKIIKIIKIMKTEDVNKNANVRKLATIAIVSNLMSIEWADSIELAQIRGWKVVVGKHEFKIGDKCIYVEVGSVLPDGLPEVYRNEMKVITKKLSKNPNDFEKQELINKLKELSSFNTRPEFEFLRQKKFICKTQNFRGTISQGIVFPLSILTKVGVDINAFELYEGRDVTDILNVIQYVEPEPSNLDGEEKGEFPINQLKSDEERLENLSHVYNKLKNYKYIVSEKLEGVSSTFIIENDIFDVCSRERKLIESDKNTIWKIAKKLDIENKMKNIADKYNLKNFNIQGEIIGEGVQGNIYKLKGQTVKFYACFNIDKQEYMEYNSFLQMIADMGLETVPIIDNNFSLPDNPDELLKIVDDFKTSYGFDFIAEGWVLVAINFDKTCNIERSGFGRLSFKAKARTYKNGKY
jgi:RNA ligase (TIGR02306 family)